MKSIFRIAVILSFGVLQSSFLFSQDNNTQVFVIDHMTNPGEVLEEIPLPLSSLEGTFYLEDEWQTGNIYLKTNQVLKNLPLRYDLEHEILEIRVQNNVKVCRPDMLKKFEWKNKESGKYQTFVNTAHFTPTNIKLHKGIMEVLVEDNVSLLKETTIKIIKSTYVPTVDVGQRNDRIKKDDKYYLQIDNKLFGIQKRKEKNLAILQDCKSLDNFIKVNHLRFNTKEDLIAIVREYNSCVE